MKKFRVVKFSRFRSIRETFLTVDDYNMNEHLESSYHFGYQESQGLLAVVVNRTFIPGV